MFLKPSMYSGAARAVPRAVITGTGTSRLKVWTVEKGSTTLVARTTPDLTSYSITSATTSYHPFWNGKYFFIAVVESTLFATVPLVILRSSDGITWSIVHNTTVHTFNGMFSSDGINDVHLSVTTSIPNEIGFIQSTDGGATFSSVAAVSPHGIIHAGYKNGDLLCYPNSSSQSHYFARRSKVDRSIIVRYPAATTVIRLSGNWIYWSKRDSFYGNQFLGASQEIAEIGADLAADAIQRKAVINNTVWCIPPSSHVGQTGPRLWVVDVDNSPVGWMLWYTDDGTTWTLAYTWAVGGFTLGSTQSKNRVGMANSTNGHILISWDNGTTFNILNLGSAQNCTICI